MPIAMKSVEILEEISVRPMGVRYVWIDVGVGLMTRVIRLLGFGHGPAIDQVSRETMGLVKYRYDTLSVQDHSIQPRVRSLFQPAAWLISALLGLIAAGIYMMYRAGVCFAQAAQLVPEDFLESGLIGMLLFVLTLGIRLWMSVRADITEQVIQERGDASEGATIKYIPLTEWAEFLANNVATSVSSSGKPAVSQPE